MKGGVQVDCEDCVLFCWWKIVYWCDVLDVGVVDEDVECVEFGDCFLYYCKYCFGFVHVGVVVNYFYVMFLFQIGGDVFCIGGLVEFIEYDVRVFGGEVFGDVKVDV